MYLKAKEIAHIRACQRLWLAVIETGMKDYEKLVKHRNKSHTLDKKALRNITVSDTIPPDDWVESEEFREVCSVVGVCPDRVKKKLFKKVGERLNNSTE